MRIMWGIVSSVIILSACATRKVEVSDYVKPNDTVVLKCVSVSDIRTIRSLLDQQQIPIDEFQVRGAVGKSCVGLYRVYSRDWKEYNQLNFNGVTIPVLKFEDKLTMNGLFLKNKPRLKDTLRVHTDISEFKQRYAQQFSEADMKQIIDSYEYGIEVLLKGYWRD